MKKLVLLFWAVYFFLGSSCQKSDWNIESAISGKWAYIGTFSHLADYACFICPHTDFKQSIYQLEFFDDGTFRTTINLMRGEGNYVLQELESPNVHAFKIVSYQELNKPYETEADGNFRKSFLRSESVSTNRIEENRVLGFEIGDNEFMLFAKL